MTHNIQIREFHREDLDTIVALIHQVVEISYKDVYPEGALKLYKEFHSRENILHDAENGYCVLAEDNGRIIGTGTLLDDGIRRVYIDPSYQNNGIGKGIYRELENKALQTGLSRLGLGASVVAREFWESVGFVFEEEMDIPAGGEQLKFYMMSKLLSGTGG
ncbi:MAG: GNAT family N-acetyltransferase [Dehalococcoidales bacterium]|nr:MAG: GNAT family N-acetyltransferase [Dehalococcoidales bacterium]